MVGYTSIAMAALLLLQCLAGDSTATVYTVGDDASGWTTGADYKTWASDKSFILGDALAFYYGHHQHTVNEVNETDYKACSTTNYISSDSSGDTMVLLRTVGGHYFVCGVPGHCTRGMKLAIMVGAADTILSTAPSSPSESPNSCTSVGSLTYLVQASLMLLVSVVMLFKLGII